jgi:hypothetical protein
MRGGDDKFAALVRNRANDGAGNDFEWRKGRAIF